MAFLALIGLAISEPKEYQSGKSGTDVPAPMHSAHPGLSFAVENNLGTSANRKPCLGIITPPKKQHFHRCLLVLFLKQVYACSSNMAVDFYYKCSWHQVNYVQQNIANPHLTLYNMDITYLKGGLDI